jgi:hypothetical protein
VGTDVADHRKSHVRNIAILIGQLGLDGSEAGNASYALIRPGIGFSNQGW